MPIAALVVEDEALVRMVAVDILLDAGFDVVEAADAAGALAVLERRNDIRAIVTDIDMPGGRSGLVLARVVAERDPGVALVVTSGRARPTASELPPGTVFLPKPYRPVGLVAGIRDALERRPGPTEDPVEPVRGPGT